MSATTHVASWSAICPSGTKTQATCSMTGIRKSDGKQFTGTAQLQLSNGDKVMTYSYDITYAGGRRYNESIKLSRTN